MGQRKIVITGGPSTGKTSLIEGLEKGGHHCFHEVIRSMTLEAKHEGEIKHFTTNPIALVSDPMDFNRKILKARVQHYREATLLPQSNVFFDRGIPDVLAYMDHFGQDYGNEFIDTAAENRYDTVFLLPIWEAIYVSDNERFESYDEALAIHDHLWEAYTRFGYHVIEVPRDTVEGRVAFISKTLNL
ncbi:ATP-binding protein [Flavobacteriaceae bacterium TP-CH-4]|uniref:ATP-binding protein n=1 Tax=Pelagihabitans pacificus TaxID=2696054 RepID=A0A967AVR8_9FLAO|nr:ATP-binding protein [Pelagihabitans pacificus]